VRVLCDHHVAPKYVQALDSERWLTVRTVEMVLARDATDGAISSHAKEHGWVVFTSDDDFFRTGPDHGLLVYSQLDDPSPGDVLVAVRRIDSVYDDAEEITEVVPGAWIDR